MIAKVTYYFELYNNFRNFIIKNISTSFNQMIKENFCTKLVFEGMEIDVSRRILYRGKKEVKVTSVEFQILHLLARNPGRVFSKEQI